MSQPAIAALRDNWLWNRLKLLELPSNGIFTSSIALLYTYIPILELRSRILPAFRLPGVKANVTVRGTTAVPVPKKAAVISVVDEPEMILFLSLILKR